MNVSADPVIHKSLVEAKTHSHALTLAGRHIPALDGIRGIAVILVVLNHLMRSLQGEFGFGQNNIALQSLTFGWIGVDLFFVLSGFLITGILFDQKTSDHYFKNFYMRRVLRILPLYYGAVVIILLLRAVWPEGGEGIYGRENPGWILIYMNNIIFAVKGSGSFGILDHFWSLAVEEHFYFVWPLVVFMFNRQQLIRVTVGIFFTVLVARIVLILFGADPGPLYVLTPLRLDSLCLGALLALLVRSPDGIQRLVGPAKIVALAAIIVIIAMILTGNIISHVHSLMTTIGYSLLALFFGSVLILALMSPLQRVFNSSILRWFGKYSYGLYVWHVPIFVLFFHSEQARAIRGGSNPVHMVISVAIALAVTFVVTLLSWKLWESQFLKLKRHFE